MLLNKSNCFFGLCAFRMPWTCLRTKPGFSDSTTMRKNGTSFVTRYIWFIYYYYYYTCTQNIHIVAISTLCSLHWNNFEVIQKKQTDFPFQLCGCVNKEPLYNYTACVVLHLLHASGEVSGEEPTPHLHPEATGLLRSWSHTKGES